MLSLHFPKQSKAGQATILVGNEGFNDVNQFSLSGANLGAFASSLPLAHNVTVDRAGDILVSYSDGFAEYSPSGTLLLNVSRSYNTGQVQVGANGDFLVNNYYGGDVLEYSPTGQYLGIFSNPGLQRAYFSAFDAQGNLYVTDQFGGVVAKISSTGVYEGNFITNIAGVVGIAFNSQGDLYAAVLGVFSGGNDRIVEYSPTGQYLGIITYAGLNDPIGIAFGPNGNLYVVNNGNDTITEYKPSGSYLGVIADTGLNDAAGIAFSTASVPEPSSAVLLIIAGVTIPIGLVLRRRSGR